MLEELRRIARDHLPLLLDQEDTSPRTLEVLYEEPRVERVWFQLDDLRLNLHRIHPCEKAFYHPHPWPSAVLILSGRYRMTVGEGSPDGPTPPIAATLDLQAGSGYEMLSPTGWHSVQPIGAPSLSLMLSGRPWSVQPTHKPDTSKNRPLTYEARESLLDDIAMALADLVATQRL